jgi:membrane protein DedA with SNARE-associated domain
MNFTDVITRIYLPLLAQETAVMVSTFTYGLKAGLAVPTLVLANSAAILTDLALFFLPAYALAERLRAFFERHYGRYYDQATRLVDRIGVFQTSVALAFVMPSVLAMLSIGLLRLAFWRALAGLFIGSALYVVIPLVLALPLAASLPPVVTSALPWVTPALAIVVILLTLLRARKRSSEP